MAGFTYLQFHAAFVVPALAVLVVGSAVRSPGIRSEVRPRPVVLVTAIALAYTTPWDNYLIQRGVWSYGTDAVTAVVWSAPVEEYLFILLQPLVAALWLHQVSDGTRTDGAIVVTRRDRALGAGAGALVSLVGFVLLARPATFYLGAILAWAGPVLALQWAVGWPYLLARWRTVALAIAVPTTYLWIADWIAIRSGVWVIADTYTVGVTVLGLPIEEALFFLLTNAFVVQALLLYPWVIDRWRRN